MPGLISHYLIGKDVTGYIYDDRIKNTILKHKDSYNLGLQGPDFYFYDIMHSTKCKGFNYGRLLHSNKTNTFFSYYLKGASNLSNEKKEIALAYFYGYLCHFSLDTLAHPYILYMACFKTDNDRDRNISATSHTVFETAIDNKMLMLKRGLTPNTLRRQDLINVSPYELNIISHVFAYAFNKTFHQNTSSEQIAAAFKNCKLTNALLQGEADIKINLLSHFEKAILKKSLITGIMYSKNVNISWDVLNRMHSEWCLPWDNTVVKNESFVDLYDDAALLASKLINAADSIVNWAMPSTEFLGLVNNRSYITGVDCDASLNMRYFRSDLKEIIQ